MRKTKLLSLYRVMCEDEFQQLMLTQKFLENPNSLEGKWFAENLDDAIKWKEQFLQLDKSNCQVVNYRIVEVNIPVEIANNFGRWQQLDGIGPARYATLEQLHDFTINVIF